MAVSMEQKEASAKTQWPKDSGRDFPGAIPTRGKAAADPDPAV